jgi:hypothetical protein
MHVAPSPTLVKILSYLTNYPSICSPVFGSVTRETEEKWEKCELGNFAAYLLEKSEIVSRIVALRNNMMVYQYRTADVPLDTVLNR